MLYKYHEFLQQQLKKDPNNNYYRQALQNLNNYLDNYAELSGYGYVPPIDTVPEFEHSFSSIFSTGDSIQEVLSYCYDELPYMKNKVITCGDKNILDIPMDRTITVDYEKCEIFVEDLPILVNSYSLFKLTLGTTL